MFWADFPRKLISPKEVHMRSRSFWFVVLGMLGFLSAGFAQTPKDVLIIGMSHEPIIDFEPARVYEFEGGFVLE